MIALDLLAAAVVAATLAALAAERVADARATRTARALLDAGHAVELLPGGWPLHLPGCWCRARQ